MDYSLGQLKREYPCGLVNNFIENNTDYDFYGDDYNAIFRALFAYSINTGRLDELKTMCDKFDFNPSGSLCLDFAHYYQKYEIWKSLAECLNIPKTILLGEYDFELLPLRFYHDLWNDIGFDAYMDSVLNGKHTYDGCLNPGVTLKGYKNQIENEKYFEKQQEKTGLICPNTKINTIDFSAH